MKKLLRTLSILVIIAGAFLLVLKTTNRFAPMQATSTVANPASVYCVEQGGSLEIITDASGGQVGMCTLPDGTVCEEWAYMRGECGQNDILLVNDFDSCVKAGNPIMESYPRQCRADDQIFVEEIEGDDNDAPVMCTMEYAPVCALVQVQCVKAPCEPTQQTFGNKCQMNANKLASFLHDGECVE